VCLFIPDAESPLPSVLHSEMEPEKELDQQLNQANDTIAWLQDDLRQAEYRQRQLQMQLDKMKDGFSQLLLQKKEFDDFEQCIVPLSEQEMKNRDSKILVNRVLYCWLISYDMLCLQP